MQRRMLMMESTEQMPRLTQTAMGGKRIAMRPRKMSGVHIVEDWMSYRVWFGCQRFDERMFRSFCRAFMCRCW